MVKEEDRSKFSLGLALRQKDIENARRTLLCIGKKVYSGFASGRTHPDLETFTNALNDLVRKALEGGVKSLPTVSGQSISHQIF